MILIPNIFQKYAYYVAANCQPVFLNVSVGTGKHFLQDIIAKTSPQTYMLKFSPIYWKVRKSARFRHISVWRTPPMANKNKVHTKLISLRQTWNTWLVNGTIFTMEKNI